MLMMVWWHCVKHEPWYGVVTVIAVLLLLLLLLSKLSFHFVKFSPIIIHKFTRLSELLVLSLSLHHLEAEHLIIREIRYISFDPRGRFMILGINVAFITRVQRYIQHYNLYYSFVWKVFRSATLYNSLSFFLKNAAGSISFFFLFLLVSTERKWVNDCERKAI